MVEKLDLPTRPLPGGSAQPLGAGEQFDEWTWEPDDPWYRVYHVNPAYDPHDYRYFGPFNRFDPHPRNADGEPDTARDGRGVSYFARDLECGLVETHPGQRPDVALCPNSRVYLASPKKSALLLDLRGNTSMAIGALNTLGSGDESRDVTQTWALAIYEDLPRYSGVLYRGAHQGGDCIALWERAGPFEILDDLDLIRKLRSRTIAALRKVRRAPLWIGTKECPDCERAGLT